MKIYHIMHVEFLKHPPISSSIDHDHMPYDPLTPSPPYLLMTPQPLIAPYHLPPACNGAQACRSP